MKHLITILLAAAMLLFTTSAFAQQFTQQEAPFGASAYFPGTMQYKEHTHSFDVSSKTWIMRGGDKDKNLYQVTIDKSGHSARLMDAEDFEEFFGEVYGTELQLLDEKKLNPSDLPYSDMHGIQFTFKVTTEGAHPNNFLYVRLMTKGNYEIQMLVDRIGRETKYVKLFFDSFRWKELE